MSLTAIFDHCGINVISHERLGGGDINRAWRLRTESGDYFIKVNKKESLPGMFIKEASGLKALKQNCPLEIPSVIKTGETDNDQYLLLEWINEGKKGEDFWIDFGKGLAVMHQKEQAHFGWEENNYIGTIVQDNTPRADWISFYSECRIIPLSEKLFHSGSFSQSDLAHAERFCENISGIFPQEKPALLHGDLWSGNFMAGENGKALIYDPAVYCGHREMDLGMTLLFGGFNERFYLAYEEQYPLEKNWRKRLPFTQLYPLMAHALLFGGNYVSTVKNILSRF